MVMLGNAVVSLADTRFFTDNSSLRHVAARTGLPNQISGSNTQSGWRCWNYNYVPCASLRIYFANFYVASTTSGIETGAGGPLTVRVSVEYPRGTFTALQTALIADGSYGYVDVPVTIPAFAWYRINGDFNYLSGGRVLSSGWSNAADRSNGDEYQVGATGYGNAQNDNVLGSGPVAAVFPAAVLAISNRRVWAALGDSIAAGVNDTIADTAGGRGILGRSLARLGPNLNYGVPGDKVSTIATSSANRIALLQLAGTEGVILEAGVNDLFSGSRTSAQVLADRATIRGLMPGALWLDTTITPATTSTDNWQTATNQTTFGAASNTQRTTFNDALRAGTALAQGSIGTIDIAALVETAPSNNAGPVLNGGVWIPGLIGYTDGNHPNSRCCEQLEPLVTRALLSRR